MIGQKRKGDKIVELINGAQEEITNNKEEEKEIYSSNKPLWIQEVKKSIECFPLSINELEFEKIEEIMDQENNETTINYEEYPFFSTTKKNNVFIRGCKRAKQKNDIKNL